MAAQFLNWTIVVDEEGNKRCEKTVLQYVILVYTSVLVAFMT